MTQSEASPLSQIQLTPEEMLEISHEIHCRFAPKAMPLITDSVDFAFNESELYTFLQPAHYENKTVFHSIHDSRIGLTPRELYDISQAIGTGFMPSTVTTMPELILLPVDPDHLYAFWDLGESKSSFLTGPGSDSGLVLRIYWHPDENPRKTTSNVWFDVDVNELTARQRVRLPIDDSAYSAALGKVRADKGFDAIAHSNIIRVPPGQARLLSLQRTDEAQGSKKSPQTAPLDRFLSLAPAIQQNTKAALIESKLSDILEQGGKAGPISENGWLIQLHFRQPEADLFDQASDHIRVKELFNKEGIDIQLIPESFFYEHAPAQGKTASGQGII